MPFRWVIRGVAVAVVLVLLAGYIGYRQQQMPVTYTCGVATGGSTVTGGGVKIARGIGDTIHDIATHPPKSSEDIEKTLRGVFHDTIWYWIKSFILSSRGQKMDPQIIRMQKKAEATQQAAQDACEPCPAGTADDNQGDSNDPSLQLTTADRNLKGAKLAASALRAAGFPADQIPMGVKVAELESSLNPTAVNPAAGGNWGMWQINSVHRTLLDRYNWRDPYDNAQMAYLVWKDAGHSWSPWSTADSARQHLGSQTTDSTDTTDAADNGNSDSSASTSAKACTTTSATPQVAAGGGQMVTANFSAYRNPRTPQQAEAWLMRYVNNKTPIRSGACLHFIAAAYGHNSTAQLNRRWWAKDQYYAAPSSAKHPGDTNPPFGALLYWDTGPGRAGHIAFALGDGRVISTDQPSRGRIGVVPFSTFSGYGTYLGWTSPTFVGKTKIAA